MWWRRCSLNHLRLCTTPAGSSESESQKLRQDKVGEWLRKCNLHNPGLYASTFPCCVSLCVSASDYGLFLSDDDPRKGIWLESGRTLDYYMLRNGVRLSHIVWGGELSVSLIISWSDLHFLEGPEIFTAYLPDCWEGLQFTCLERSAGLWMSLCFLSGFLRMFWSIRRNKGHKRSKCWTVQLKPSWWMTQKQLGSCLSPYAAE